MKTFWILVSFIGCTAVFFSQGWAEETELDVVKTEMKQVNWLIGKGKSTQAFNLIKKSKYLGGVNKCGFKKEAFQNDIEADIRRETNRIRRRHSFRYFADLGVVLRKQGQFVEAAICVEKSGWFATNSKQMHSVLIEAERLIRKLDFEGIGILTEPQFHGAVLCADDTQYRQFQRAEEDLLDEMFSSDERESYQRTAAESVKILKNPKASPDNRQRALKEYRQAFSRHLLEVAFEQYPTSSTYRKLIKLGGKDLERRLFGGKMLSKGVGVKSFSSRKLAMKSLKPSVGKSYDRFAIKVTSSVQTKMGKYELVTATKYFGTDCESDEGIAYLFFKPKSTKAVQVVRIGSIHWNESCGSGGWADHGSVSVENVSAKTANIHVGLVGGEIIKKNKQCTDNLVDFTNGTDLYCQPDKNNQLLCIGADFWSIENSHRAFPTLNFTKTGEVYPSYNNVDKKMWSPFKAQLSGNISDVFKHLPHMRKEILSK